MKRLNLILDFNNLATRALFTCQYTDLAARITNFDADEECAALARKMAMDVAYIVRLFEPNRIIFACDSRHPWRGSLYDDIEGESYKGTRTKDETKNWTKIYSTFDDLKEIFSKYGFAVSSIDTAEADDLSALWIDKIFRKGGENIVFVSSDKDWAQQISFNKQTHAFCVGFNPIANNKGRKKLLGTQEFFDWLQSPDPVDLFFNTYDETKKRINTAITNDPKIDLAVTSPEGILLEKILCGDGGDNVPAFYDYYKNGKKQRVTELKAKKLCEALSIHTAADLVVPANNGNLTAAIESVMKTEIRDLDAPKRLYRQRRLVELNVDLFPTEIRDEFDVQFEKLSNAGFIQAKNIKGDDILEGTKYLNKNFSKPKENSIFADVTGLEKFMKPLF